MPNRLAQETSPYLHQHQNNPVDWYPWGPEAMEKAKAEDKLIFLSIGYSSCHWCHVMEHESFEDETTASLLNEKFVSVKVDREERPDLDAIYMNFVQMLTGHGGWPMSVFMMPDGRPIYGGTYWPPEPRMNMPSFRGVLEAVSELWTNNREKATEQAGVLAEKLQQAETERTLADGSVPLSQELLQDAEAQLKRLFDFQYGGFGRAPKFPHASDLTFLMRRWRRTGEENLAQMVALNLNMMARGGIYDHLAGGFARYSVDERWLVPHFEKMLYDNALLTGVYLEAFQVGGNTEYARVAKETCDYVLNYMTDPQGGFYSAEDADSEGEEGKFYVWSPEEIRSVLGEDLAEKFCYVYDVSEHGNFEGQSILNLPKTLKQCCQMKDWDLDQLQQELDQARAKLLVVRDQRVRPGKDDKVLVSWNALMIESLARAGNLLRHSPYLEAAEKAAAFLIENLRRDDGRLLHTWRAGQAKLDAYLDDYTFLANALVTLYEETFNERWIDAAAELCDTVLEHFRAGKTGGFFFTADDHEQLLVRSRDFFESSIPSGNAMAATALLRLGRLTGNSDYLAAAEETLHAAAELMQKTPNGTGQMLNALDMYLGPMPEVLVLGDAATSPTSEVLANLRDRYLPNRLLSCRPSAGGAGGSDRLNAIYQGKQAAGEEPTVFVCQNFTCGTPASGKDAAIAKWDELEVNAGTE